jgi:hypothetical protein
MGLLLSGIALRRFGAGLQTPPYTGPKVSRGAPAWRPAVSPVARSGDLATTRPFAAGIPGSYLQPVPGPITWLLLSGIALLLLAQSALAQEPPSLNPFGNSGDQKPRDDSIPGYLETSDGRVHPGQLFLTRDARLKIYDEERKRQREIPLKAIKRIDCVILKEWVEKEWRFKENASDEKYYTGRSYPAREYTHKITLQNGQAIAGTLSAIVYVQADANKDPERYLLHKRDKGNLGTDLKALVYVRSIQLGEKALEDGKRKVAKAKSK